MTNNIIQLKPVKKTRTVQYWSCGIDAEGHWHKGRDVAQKCVDKRAYPARLRMTLAERAKINKIFFDYWISGDTIKEASRKSHWSYGHCVSLTHVFCRIASRPDNYESRHNTVWSRRRVLEGKLLYPVTAGNKNQVIVRHNAMTPTRLKIYKESLQT